MILARPFHSQGLEVPSFLGGCFRPVGVPLYKDLPLYAGCPSISGWGVAAPPGAYRKMPIINPVGYSQPHFVEESSLVQCRPNMKTGGF